jgi:hypothetical protein
MNPYLIPIVEIALCVTSASFFILAFQSRKDKSTSSTFGEYGVLTTLVANLVTILN